MPTKTRKKPAAKPSLVAELAEQAKAEAAARTRAKIRGPALDFLREVLKHNDAGGVPITLALVRKALREKFDIDVTDGAIYRTAQTKLGRTSWVSR